ncbi:MBL fold metallo-hydrolase [Jeotgalibacillus terrae]|uniref:MBL fold metallo-hydrolase n=1 Tax=Jeotgalibacillus terrae TaxID=587735 RepID=A0ABW5ZJD3_9BACL|nr:MBL fold metallo-hydrolase [Jeotgalibacillus terrae]MBM7577504.1 glyoxylase-like metal-dependent hydrolase (beta-lactamase superfamily II) [Jeotgalibacillus terrae]
MKDPIIHQLTIPTPFAVGDVHTYLLVHDTVTLVDTGPDTAEGKETLIKKLNEIGFQPEDIDQIVLTHHHPDHAGLTEFFSHAKLFAHHDSERFLVRNDSFMNLHDFFYNEFFKQAGLPEAYFILIEKMKETLSVMGNRPVDAYLADGDLLPGHQGWSVMESHGHSQGHISLIHENGMVIGGDLLIRHISSNPLIEPPFGINQPRPLPQLQYNESLKKLAALNPTIVYPGHGEVIVQAAELISERLIKQEERAGYVRSLLQKKETTVFDLCTQLFPKIYKKQLGLTLSETQGQIDYLMAKGEIRAADMSGSAIIYKTESRVKL